ncbi:MAG: sporulation integral membrane protein YtvI [Oscillospiraceae bacterium]
MPSLEKMRAFIIKFVFYGLICALVYIVIKYAMPFLTPFLLGFAIAFCLKPLINKITEKTHLSRKPVAVLILIVFYAIVGALITVLGTRIIILLRDLFMSLPSFYESTISPALIAMQNQIETIVKQFNPTILDFIDAVGNSIANSLSGFVTSISSGAITAVTSAATHVPSFFVKFLLTIIVSFFCVVDYYTITKFFAKQMPESTKEMLMKIKTSGIDVLFKFAKAYAMLLTITFVELAIGLSLFRVQNSILVAFVISLVDILPILGTGTILIPWGIFSLIMGDFPFGIGMLILYAIITVVRQSLEPRVVGKQIGLYPLVTLVCMFVGAQLFGIWGLFGLPIAVTILVQLNKANEIKLYKK